MFSQWILAFGTFALLTNKVLFYYASHFLLFFKKKSQVYTQACKYQNIMGIELSENIKVIVGS